mmetsp:Transcript_62589/g.135585  ORF Transcript_62589/g.135585 Transcript_62589/m.135585 type:complete len:111 (+) Transcript_62589:345-677(+)
MYIYRKTGIPLPLVFGRWGLPWLLPNKTPLDLVVGRKIQVQKKDKIEQDYVDEIFEKLKTEIIIIFENGKHKLDPEVARKGLVIERRSSGKGKGKGDKNEKGEDVINTND